MCSVSSCSDLSSLPRSSSFALRRSSLEREGKEGALHARCCTCTRFYTTRMHVSFRERNQKRRQDKRGSEKERSAEREDEEGRRERNLFGAFFGGLCLYACWSRQKTQIVVRGVKSITSGVLFTQITKNDDTWEICACVNCVIFLRRSPKENTMRRKLFLPDEKYSCKTNPLSLPLSRFIAGSNKDCRIVAFSILVTYLVSRFFL